MSGKMRTAGEIEAQRVQRERRYANSVGKGYCELYTGGRMCPHSSARHVGDLWICQHHSDLLDAIVRDGQKKRSVAA